MGLFSLFSSASSEMTCFDETSITLLGRSCFVFFGSLERVRPFYVGRLSPTEQKYIDISWGSPKTPVLAFSEARRMKKMLGVSPSMRVFGSRSSGARSDASRSRRELASASPTEI